MTFDFHLPISELRPLLADADIGQAIFVIVFLVVAFIQWLFKLLKDKAEAAKRESHVPTEEESEARRRAWENQTRPVDTPPSSGGTLGDLLGEMRRAFDDSSAPTPPPLPPPPQPKRAATPAPRPLAPPSPVSTTPTLTPSPPSLVRKREPHPLTRLLRSEDGYRQAFVLREILGPPHALHEYRGPLD